MIAETEKARLFKSLASVFQKLIELYKCDKVLLWYLHDDTTGSRKARI